MINLNKQAKNKQAKNKEEKQWIKQIIKMAINIRQQIRLREKYDKEKEK